MNTSPAVVTKPFATGLALMAFSLASIPALNAADAQLSMEQVELERQKLEIERQQLELLKQELELEKNKTEFGFLETEEMVTMALQADVLFDFGESSIGENGDDMLGKVSNLIQQVDVDTIFVEGHTDSRGTESVNMQLSEERAMAVKRQLVDNGIDEDLIQIKGFGETEPVAHNTLPDGRDFPEGRQRNRRVEIRIDKLSQEEMANVPETQVIEEEGYTLVRVQSDRVLNYQSEDVEPAADDVLGKAISLIKRYENQPVTVQVHTDADPTREGDDVELSEELAEEVEELLATNGIDTSRVVTEGFGNTRPIDYNTEPDGSDYPEGRALNRRVEFRFLTGE